jgi:phospholipase C
MDAGLTWRNYAPINDETGEESGYGWSICPTFADCIYSEQFESWVPNEEFIPDALAGDLPHLSFVIPHHVESQHNGTPIIEGDNWIGSLVSAVMEGPDWESTAIFITWDDCGCFYDHFPPPEGAGIRVPMIIVSPYARPGFTDSNTATFASMHAFVERTFGLAPMSTRDYLAYDYWESFDFGQEPIAPIRLAPRPVPEWQREYMRLHPPLDEFT